MAAPIPEAAVALLANLGREPAARRRARRSSTSAAAAASQMARPASEEPPARRQALRAAAPTGGSVERQQAAPRATIWARAARGASKAGRRAGAARSRSPATAGRDRGGRGGAAGRRGSRGTLEQRLAALEAPVARLPQASRAPAMARQPCRMLAALQERSRRSRPGPRTRRRRVERSTSGSALPSRPAAGCRSCRAASIS